MDWGGPSVVSIVLRPSAMALFVITTGVHPHPMRRLKRIPKLAERYVGVLAHKSSIRKLVNPDNFPPSRCPPRGLASRLLPCRIV